MGHEGSWYPTDGKEARKFFLGYVVLVAEKLGFDNQEDRKKAILLAKAYVNGEVSDEIMNEVKSKLSVHLDDEDFWRSRGTEKYVNIMFSLLMSDIDPRDEYDMDTSFDNMMLAFDKIGLKTDGEYELRKDYFARYKTKG